jgi:GT2 family glycosyltransferase
MTLAKNPVLLSVIVPAWNAAEIFAPHLPRLLEEADSFPGGVEVIVVDDGSLEGLPPLEELLGKANGPVRLLRRGAHSGFAVTANAGARSANGEYLLFLNDDMHVEEGCFSALVESLARRPDVFAVSPVVVNLEEGLPESTIRTRFHRGVFDHVFPGRAGTPPPARGTVRRVAYACGGAFACRRAEFLELGGFPEMLSPVYWEDAGLGWIARRHGFESIESGDGLVLHDHARTVANELTSRQIREYYEKNRLLFTWIHLVGLRAWLSHVAWMPLRLGASLLRHGSLLRAFVAALGSLGDVRRSRASLASTMPRAYELVEHLRRAHEAGWPDEGDSPLKS